MLRENIQAHLSRVSIDIEGLLGSGDLDFFEGFKYPLKFATPS